MSFGARATVLLYVATVLFTLPVFGEMSSDPDTWYREDYAPLWADNPGANIARLKTFYADEIVTHEMSGAITREARSSWLVEPLQEWLADGWLSAELTAVRTQRINDTTATFMAQWRDRYADGESESSCGWYLADRVDGRWIFTEYAEVECETQAFE